MDAGTAQFILSNAPSCMATVERDSQISKLEHHVRRGHIRDMDGNAVSLRPNAATQRVRSNQLTSIDDIEVIELYSKPYSSNFSSVTATEKSNDIDWVDRMQRLKERAMMNIKNGALNTKATSKRLFREYQIIGSDSLQYDN